ncbi:hypothetical protein AN640_06090 [Candidatus Epulonipiscium fishelsonii]|uniref:Uncharacterized protein n=1 Tax=Candidatus Epulonipiscium fishelsonii TaxID=77094 RepID=A0ACC8XHF7_9FIRM|nr:hypothetical protein AN640_06090 [Epulopiscium sp. SCG-D08WGA-EpuloA1]
MPAKTLLDKSTDYDIFLVIWNVAYDNANWQKKSKRIRNESINRHKMIRVKSIESFGKERYKNTFRK